MSILKKKTKLIAYLLTIVFLMWMLNFFVSATDYYMTSYFNLTHNGTMSPRLRSGSHNVPFHLSAVWQFDAYRDNARAATLSWNNVSRDIHFVQTTVFANSVVDLVSFDGSTASHINWRSFEGMARLWFGSGPFSGNNQGHYIISNFPRQDFWAAEAFINRALVPASSTDHVRSTFAHEVGHALGLFHLTGDTIMTATHSPNRTTPSANDFRRVYALYNIRWGQW